MLPNYQNHKFDVMAIKSACNKRARFFCKFFTAFAEALAMVFAVLRCNNIADISALSDSFKGDDAAASAGILQKLKGLSTGLILGK